MSEERRDLLEQQADSAYLLSLRGLQVLWTNSAFQRFATENSAGPSSPPAVIGRPILDFVPAPLTLFYRNTYARVSSTGEPARHDYECSSATEVRWFAQYILPEKDQLAIINTRLFTTERGTIASVGDWAPYLSPRGLATQCCHCRRLKNLLVGSWELFQDCFDASEHTPPLTHGLCDLCFSYFFENDAIAPQVATYTKAVPRPPRAIRWLSEVS